MTQQKFHLVLQLRYIRILRGLQFIHHQLLLMVNTSLLVMKQLQPFIQMNDIDTKLRIDAPNMLKYILNLKLDK